MRAREDDCEGNNAGRSNGPDLPWRDFHNVFIVLENGAEAAL